MLNLNKILEPAKTIAIGGHVRPDGDCVGSCMAMYQYIQNNYPDKEVDVFLEEIPSTFYRIKGTDEILHEIDESKHYDLFIVLDCGDTGCGNHPVTAHCSGQVEQHHIIMHVRLFLKRPSVRHAIRRGTADNRVSLLLQPPGLFHQKILIDGCGLYHFHIPFFLFDD